MFKIGDFSKLTNLTVRALHHYEELELLLPHKIDPTTNYRYYAADQLAVVNKIKLLQQIGLPLKTIKKVIQSNDLELLDYHYELREAEIRSQLEELKKKQTVVKMFKEKMKEEPFMAKYNVELKKLPQRNVIAIRKVVPSFDDEHQLWTDLYEGFMEQQVKMDIPPLGMTIYHDTEYKDSEVDLEVQSSIVGNYHNTDKVKFYKAPEFTMASVTFNGSYEQMPEITQVIASWIEANNYAISGPMVNISHVSPAQDPNPDNWITEAGFMVSTD